MGGAQQMKCDLSIGSVISGCIKGSSISRPVPGCYRPRPLHDESLNFNLSPGRYRVDPSGATTCSAPPLLEEARRL